MKSQGRPLGQRPLRMGVGPRLDRVEEEVHSPGEVPLGSLRDQVVSDSTAPWLVLCPQAVPTGVSSRPHYVPGIQDRPVPTEPSWGLLQPPEGCESDPDADPVLVRHCVTAGAGPARLAPVGALLGCVILREGHRRPSHSLLSQEVAPPRAFRGVLLSLPATRRT